MNKTSLLTIASLCIMTSCATVFTGTKQNIRIESVPSGAEVQVNGAKKGVTPAIVRLKKGSNAPLITLKSDGYEPTTFEPETTFNAVAVINLFSVLGWGIDAISGALWKYDPKYYQIQLEKKK